MLEEKLLLLLLLDLYVKQGWILLPHQKQSNLNQHLVGGSSIFPALHKALRK